MVKNENTPSSAHNRQIQIWHAYMSYIILSCQISQKMLSTFSPSLWNAYAYFYRNYFVHVAMEKDLPKGTSNKWRLNIALSLYNDEFYSPYLPTDSSTNNAQIQKQDRFPYNAQNFLPILQQLLQLIFSPTLPDLLNLPSKFQVILAVYTLSRVKASRRLTLKLSWVFLQSAEWNRLQENGWTERCQPFSKLFSLRQTSMNPNVTVSVFEQFFKFRITTQVHLRCHLENIHKLRDQLWTTLKTLAPRHHVVISDPKLEYHLFLGYCILTFE